MTHVIVTGNSDLVIAIYENSTVATQGNIATITQGGAEVLKVALNNLGVHTVASIPAEVTAATYTITGVSNPPAPDDSVTKTMVSGWRYSNSAFVDAT